MKKVLIAVVLVIGLGGSTCSQDQGVALMNSCAAAESGLKIITALKAQGKLSKIQIIRIDQAVHAITPICGAEAVIDVARALDILEYQLLVLNGVMLEPGSDA